MCWEPLCLWILHQISFQHHCVFDSSTQIWSLLFQGIIYLFYVTTHVMWPLNAAPVCFVVLTKQTGAAWQGYVSCCYWHESSILWTAADNSSMQFPPSQIQIVEFSNDVVYIVSGFERRRIPNQFLQLFVLIWAVIIRPLMLICFFVIVGVFIRFIYLCMVKCHSG